MAPHPDPGPPWQRGQKRSVQPGFPRRFGSGPVTVAAVGDLLLGSDWPTPDLPDRNPLRHAGKILRAADLAFGNLEGPLCDGGSVHPGKASGKHSFAFRMPTRLGLWLQEAGFDALSVANNHAGDFQEEGRRQTVETLSRLEIEPVGAAGRPFARKVPQGTPVILVGFATNGINPNLNDIDAAVALVRQARRRAGGGFVVVSFHGGAEGSGRRRVPRGAETFHGERRGDLRRFAHAVVDAGAGLVVGHGPHVLRGMEVYKRSLIAYSLGNFATWSKMSLSGPLGRTAILEARIDPDGFLISGRVHPFVQTGKGIPVPDPKGAAIRDLIALSKADFGRNAPRIAADGALLPPA